jgi:hypothetical protein
MESTGVYWIPLYQILERRGLQVFLVNVQHAIASGSANCRIATLPNRVVRRVRNAFSRSKNGDHLQRTPALRKQVLEGSAESVPKTIVYGAIAG